MFDTSLFRQSFPYFEQQQSVYLDSAATSLKPQVLIDATIDYYQTGSSVHRSQHQATQTALFEQARQQVAHWIGIESANQVIWTTGATHGINLVAHGLSTALHSDDEIIITQWEHHANYLPWIQLAKDRQAQLKIAKIDSQGKLSLTALIQLLSVKTKVIALSAMSNVSGEKLPIESLIPQLRQHAPNALILLDCAQLIAHQSLNVTDWDVDFVVFSAHKIYGPTGLGVLAGKREALEKLTPLFYGGKMVSQVSHIDFQLQPLPYRLEAGTPNIAAVLGFKAVLDWLNHWDYTQAHQYLTQLANKLYQRLHQYQEIQLMTQDHHSPIISFYSPKIASADLNILLAEQGIALRTGEHCAQPYLQALGVKNTLRLSLAPYNNQEDIEQFFTALDKALLLLRE